MFGSLIFDFLSLCAAAVLAKPLQIVDENIPSSSISNLIDAAFVSNSSTNTSILNTPATNFMSITCDGDSYGFNPNIADCEGAAQMVAPSTEQLIWRDRVPGLPGDFFPLPFAVFGGKS